MPEEKNLSLVNTVEDIDKIRVVTSTGLSHSIEVGHLKSSLSVDDLPDRVSELEGRVDDQASNHTNISSEVALLKSTMGEEIVSGNTVTNSGLFQKISEIRSDLTALHLGDVTRLDSELSGIRADITSISGANGRLDVLEEDIANLANPKLEVLENYREKLVTLSGTSTTINLSLANVFTHTLSGNTTYTITNAASGQAHSFTLIVNQPATVRTLTFPTSVKWQGGEIPDLTTASKTYVLTFMTVNGGATWLGMFGGEF